MLGGERGESRVKCALCTGVEGVQRKFVSDVASWAESAVSHVSNVLCVQG